jgi:hypothetical protein
MTSRGRNARCRRVKILNPTANAQADEAYAIFAIGPFRRLTARLPGPRLCLSPQPHRVRHELRPPALATPARRPGGLQIASSTRAARSGAGPVNCIVGSASAASCANTTDTPLNAVPSRQACRITRDRSRPKTGSPLAVVAPSLYDNFPAAPLQPKTFTYASRKYTSFILLACVRVF